MSENILLNKAQQIYEDLQKRLNFKSIPTTFIADEGKKELFEKICDSENPFPEPFQHVLTEMRKPAIKKLFDDEIIPQSAAIAAVLSACSSVATEIGNLRGDDTTDAKTLCDIAFSGMQAIRLFVSNYTGEEFQKARLQSAARVNNALNGALHKYRSADGRDVSFHAYYMDQQRKLVEGLQLSKPYEQYNMMSVAEDCKELSEISAQKSAKELENLSFDCGACGCMLRTREEWEDSEVGKAVTSMPLIRTKKETDTPIPSWGKVNKQGPLSGIRVLDLTHIIAGPACSRILAEYGADVLLVRRGRFIEQEQSLNEYDGWAGKRSIQLDFNIPEQLARVKELIQQADIIIYSYQNGALDKFGLSETEIRKLNPGVIYADLMCFSDTVWKDRPGWAPCAEDITGLSIRNGTLENPVNLNGVPLDYFPGFILALGTLLAIAEKIKTGGGYHVTTSLTRGAQYLHQCADLCKDPLPVSSSFIATKNDEPTWNSLLHYVDGCSVGGNCGFPSPATVNTKYPFRPELLRFTDGNTGWDS